MTKIVIIPYLCCGEKLESEERRLRKDATLKNMVG
jgi:hypothetical protein